jgi:hypothetical protein
MDPAAGCNGLRRGIRRRHGLTFTRDQTVLIRSEMSAAQFTQPLHCLVGHCSHLSRQSLDIDELGVSSMRLPSLLRPPSKKDSGVVFVSGHNAFLTSVPENLVDGSAQIAAIRAAPIHLLEESIVCLPGFLSRILLVEDRFPRSARDSCGPTRRKRMRPRRMIHGHRLRY